MKLLGLLLALATACYATEWHDVGGPNQLPVGHMVEVPSNPGAAAVFVGRARLGDGGLHPATVVNGVCSISYKGSVIVCSSYEVVTDATPVWCGQDWQKATPIGLQKPNNLYFCRAAISVAGRQVGWAYGKAYHTGRHANLAYLMWGGQEIELSTGYELLRLEPLEKDQAPKPPG